MTTSEKIHLINSILSEYFANPYNPRKIQAKELMPLFIQKGVFNADRKNGLPIRQLLRKLDENNQLGMIPFVLAERKSMNTNWYFIASKDSEPYTAKPVVVKVPASSKNTTNSRTNSDEYYVISLCNEVLGKTASQQHKFDFLLSDSGRPLPVDAYYEELNLVIEYHERQHTEAVKFFDRRMTISGVSRGEQRRIYDERRQTILPQHGIKLVIIDYTDFGTSKNLSRNHDKDLETVRKILKSNGIIS